MPNFENFLKTENFRIPPKMSAPFEGFIGSSLSHLIIVKIVSQFFTSLVRY